MLTITPSPRPVAAPRVAAHAPARPAATVYRADSLQLTHHTPLVAVRPTALGPGAKIALLAAPVALGAGIGFAVGGPVGALVGAGVGALVSVIGLWWAMTDKPWGDKPGTPPVPPEPPQP